MSSSRIIAVVGATGAQGGGLIRAILADPASGFGVRAVTRKAAATRPQNCASSVPKSSRRISMTSLRWLKHSRAPTAHTAY
jgi:hypothetical protein